MEILFYVLIAILIGVVFVTGIIKRSTCVILSSIPGFFGVYFVTRYFGLTNSCGGYCDIDLAGKFLLLANVLLIISAVCVSIVIISTRIRTNK